MNDHKLYRDRVAALEAELAHSIKNELGYEVMGEHPKRKPFDNSLFAKLWSRFREELL